MLLLALLACSGSIEAPPPRPVVLAAREGPGPLLNVVADRGADLDLAHHLQVPLVLWREGAAHPAWATDWAWSSDGRRLTLTLAPGRTWSDGTPLTPEDLRLAWDLVRDPDVVSPLLRHAAGLIAESPVILDATHVAFDFEAPGLPARTLWNLSRVLPVPAHRLADADRATLRGHPEARTPLSSGRWLLAVHEPGSHFRLDANPRSPEGTASPQVLWRVLPDAAAQRIDFERGELDVLTDLRDHDASDLDALPGVRLEHRGFTGLQIIAWNLADPVLADRRVRLALALAADLDRLVAEAGTVATTAGELPLSVRAAGFAPPELTAFQTGLTPTPHDPDRARAQLAQAGWVDADGDGLRERDGLPCRIVLDLSAHDPARKEVAIRLQAWWAAVGVRVELNPLAAGGLFPRVLNRQHQAALVGYSAQAFVELDPVLSDAAVGRSRKNVSGYSDPQVDAAVLAYQQATRLEDAVAAVAVVDQHLLDDQPFLMLGWTAGVLAVQERLLGVSGDPHDLWAGLEDWAPAPAP